MFKSLVYGFEKNDENNLLLQKKIMLHHLTIKRLIFVDFLYI